MQLNRRWFPHEAYIYDRGKISGLRATEQSSLCCHGSTYESIQYLESNARLSWRTLLIFYSFTIFNTTYIGLQINIQLLWRSSTSLTIFNCSDDLQLLWWSSFQLWKTTHMTLLPQKGDTRFEEKCSGICHFKSSTPSLIQTHKTRPNKTRHNVFCSIKFK